MTKTEKIEKLIDLEYPLTDAIGAITDGMRSDFAQLEDGVLSKENQTRCIEEMAQALAQLGNDRRVRLAVIYDKLEETAIDAMLCLHEHGSDINDVLKTTHELKWRWVNKAKEMSPTYNDFVIAAGVNWVVNNTEGDVAESVAEQPLEDLKAPVLTEQNPESA